MFDNLNQETVLTEEAVSIINVLANEQGIILDMSSTGRPSLILCVNDNLELLNGRVTTVMGVPGLNLNDPHEEDPLMVSEVDAVFNKESEIMHKLEVFDKDHGIGMLEEYEGTRAQFQHDEMTFEIDRQAYERELRK